MIDYDEVRDLALSGDAVGGLALSGDNQRLMATGLTIHGLIVVSNQA